MADDEAAPARTTGASSPFCSPVFSLAMRANAVSDLPGGGLAGIAMPPGSRRRTIGRGGKYPVGGGQNGRWDDEQ
jgi:hypothetical protein